MIEHNEDTEEFYRNVDDTQTKKDKIDWNTIKLTDECVEEVKKILND